MSPVNAVPLGLMGFALMASALANRVLFETQVPPARPQAVAPMCVAPARARLALIDRASTLLRQARGN